jgi:hypothetical protein
MLLLALRSLPIPNCAATNVYRSLLSREVDFYLIQEFTLSSKRSFRLTEPSYLVSTSGKVAKPLFNNCISQVEIRISSQQDAQIVNN